MMLTSQPMGRTGKASSFLLPSIRCAKLLILFVFAMYHLALSAYGQKPVLIDAELVTQSTDSVWYNSKTEEIKPATGTEPSMDVSQRHSSISGPAQRWTIFEIIQRFLSYVRDIATWTFSAWRAIFIIALIAIVALLVFLVVRYGVFDGTYLATRSHKVLSAEEQAIKIKELPFELESSSMTLMEQARRHRDAGDYAKAMMYLFSHLLVDLDHARFIRLARGKTNRVYLSELRPQLALYPLMSDVVSLFEWSFFGKHEISKDGFEAIWSQLPQFEEQLRIPDASKSSAKLGTALAFSTLLLSTGCWRSLSSEYGVSEGYNARMSPGSVSILRRACDRSGRSTKLIRSLTPNAQSTLDAIVWVPDRFPNHDNEVLDWMDKWLLEGDKTLVYVGRDYSPIADYWQQSIDHWESQDPNSTKQVQAKRSWAAAQASLDGMRAQSRVLAVLPWCYFDFEDSIEKQLQRVEGPWSEQLDSADTRVLLRGYPKDLRDLTVYQFKERLGYVEAAPTNANTSTNTGTPRAPNRIPNRATPTNIPPSLAPDYAFKLQPEDERMLSILESAVDRETTFAPLLESDDGEPLIAEITHPQWNGSRVLVIANASLVANVGLAHSGNRLLLERLVGDLPQGSVGFISGPMEPRIRSDEASEQQKGFEMLTIWPLNIISIHSFLLGILALLASFPIFGRPKNLPQASGRDFGQHVDAIGIFLQRSKDRFYALATIGDYFRIVRKDPTSPWATITPESKDEAKSPFASNPPSQT
jgi:hypothetical protein